MAKLYSLLKLKFAYHGYPIGTELIVVDRDDERQVVMAEVGPWDEHGAPTAIMDVPLLMI